MDNELLQNLRRDYRAASLDIGDVQNDPFQQFQKWFSEAVEVSADEPNAMTLATVSPEGKPSARVVLLKGFDNQGFVFYTNYTSKKANDIAQNPNVALCFWWYALERQVRIEGEIEKVSEEESSAYFRSRPRGSQIGALASPQSQVVTDREELEKNFSDLLAKYGNTEGGSIIPKPAHWGGYRVRPTSIEFWQGRRSRLHDRLRYVFIGEGEWRIERIAP